MTDTILDVRGLQIQFQKRDRVIQAVDGISFEVKRGQTLGIVGESGSGKSVTALAIMGLVPSPPGQISGGEIWLNGEHASGSNGHTASPAAPVDLLALPPQDMQHHRGGTIAMIFQEPMSSLNPVYTCGFQLVEALCQHEPLSKPEARRRAASLLQEVKLLPSDEELQQEYLDQLQERHLIGSARSPRSQAERASANGSGFAAPSTPEVQAYVNDRKRAMLDRYPHELSGGQIQRVMIAMAIASNPSVLIADEPTTALDVTVQAKILDLLRELRDRRGMAMIFITHDLSIIADIADTVAVMYQGKIVEHGSVLDIFANPQHPYTKGLLACRPRPDQRLRCLPTVSDFMEVTTTRDGSITIREKSPDLCPDPDLEIQVPDDSAQKRLHELTQQPPILAVRSLHVGFRVRGNFGRTQRYLMAVNGVSFEVYPGETLGLVGESGCGKSTLACTLLRLIQPISGQITFDGRDVVRMETGSFWPRILRKGDTSRVAQNAARLGAKQLRQLRREMQIIFQDPFSSLDPRMTIGEAVMEPMRIHGVGGSQRQQRIRAAELLDRVGLNPKCIDRYPHEFSGGQRQRICIARALALNPKFIICDESVSALDVSVQAQVLNLLKGLQSEFGLTYIFISHDLAVVKFMSDRIMVMNRGKIEEIGDAEQIYQNPQSEYTQELIASIPVGSIEQIQMRQQERQAIA
ncbi:MAG: ABC transporter ATP-binding protein [Synechococcales bacterium]|nr:ABC transporter ATP-binding protein [Synechococcales bacterium]